MSKQNTKLRWKLVLTGCILMVMPLIIMGFLYVALTSKYDYLLLGYGIYYPPTLAMNLVLLLLWVVGVTLVYVGIGGKDVDKK